MVKKTSSTKKAGGKSHFFSKFTKKFDLDENKEGNLEINVQSISNKKYLKLYRIDSALIDNYQINSLKNFINYEYLNNEKDLFFNLHASVFSDLSDEYNDKYEYVVPELNFNKNLYSDNLGYGSFKTNVKVSNYDTNKYEKYFINDFDWSFDKSLEIYLMMENLLLKLKM